MKKRLRKCCAVLLSICMVISMCSPSSGQYTEAKEEHDGNLYMGKDYQVSFRITDCWNGGYNATVTIENTGKAVIENWYIGFELEDSVSNLWNGVFTEHENHYCTVKNAGWNQDIPAGQSVSFGFTAIGNVKKAPEKYSMFYETVLSSKKDYEVIYKVENDWQIGFTASIVINNLSNKAIEDWKLQFDFQNEISNIWGGDIKKKERNGYYIDNGQYNQNIEKGGSVSFGFIVNSGDALKLPKHFELYSINNEIDGNRADDERDTTPTQEPSLSEKINMELNINYEEFEYNSDIDTYIIRSELEKLYGTVTPIEKVKSLQYKITNNAGGVVSDGKIFVEENWSIKNLPLNYGSNNITIYAVDVNGDITKCVFQLYNCNMQNAAKMLKNQDLTDQLADEDSDGDGLYDFLESEMMKTNPFIVDSDQDGTEDGEEDFDADGLTNSEELKLGTDLLMEDTDGDGLPDGEELKKYHTDPLKADTDGDGASDQWEMENGYDPIKREECFTHQEVLTLDDNIAEVSVKITSKDGLAAETLSVSKTEDVFLNDEIPGYLGTGVEFSSEGSFQTAQVSFRLKEEMFEKTDIEPVLYYFNEEKQLLEEVDGQHCDGNHVTAILQHFSRYILLDRREYESEIDWTIQEIKGESDPYDYVYMVDNAVHSQSCLQTIKMLLSSYVSVLGENDYARLFPAYSNYDSWIYTNDKEKILSCINTLHTVNAEDSGLFLETYTALLTLLKGDDNYREDSIKRLVVFAKEIKCYYFDPISALIESANQENISVYIVDISGGSDEGLERLARETGGKYVSIYNIADALNFFTDSAGDEDLNKDTDSDGICDYYEKEINAGNLRLGTGISLKGLNYQSADTDGDGIDDGEEISIVKKDDRVYIKMKSNPTEKDTDGDGLMDGKPIYAGSKKIAPKDPEPLYCNGPKGIWQKQCQMELAGNIPGRLVEFGWLGNDWFRSETSLWEKFAAAYGNAMLRFKKDERGIAYHSQVYAWQHTGGYNEIYDTVFELATNHNMRKEKFPYKVGDDEHMIWVWRGDYLNLGSGAEIGLYGNPVYLPKTSVVHWMGAYFALPMTLNLYNYYSETNIDNIFCWAPEENQWWITGFNQNFNHPVVEDMVSLGTISFYGREELFEGLKRDISRDTYLRQFMIFDDEEPVAWFEWWEAER